MGLRSLPQQLGTSIRLSTWNLGYAGLGADSDFITDGGRSRMPPSRRSVRRNLEGILSIVGALSPDVFLFQEVSDFSPLSWWVNVRTRLQAVLAGSALTFRQDVGTRHVPTPLRIIHGKLTSARATPLAVEVLALPTPPQGPLRMRQFGVLVTRFAIAGAAGQWVIGNLHLSAFDEGGRLRQEQLAAVLAFAAAEYAKGNHVVLGGDWNMVLADPHYPSNTDPKYLFWIVDFPRDKLPLGWSIAADPSKPTVRTLHKSYVAGENYVTAIDGFLVSPNVVIESVVTTDTGFAPSDHMPVTAVLRAR